ncbi:hypothetical protein C8R44DRAFT_746686 [Mycena epipterygia]|nr:hypothetical protein C8R44DRAFT_746686 [Mycena epipterygia]
MEAVCCAEILNAERKRRERKLGTDAGANGLVDRSARLRTVPRLFESKTPTSRLGMLVDVSLKTGRRPPPCRRHQRMRMGMGRPRRRSRRRFSGDGDHCRGALRSLVNAISVVPQRPEYPMCDSTFAVPRITEAEGGHRHTEWNAKPLVQSSQRRVTQRLRLHHCAWAVTLVGASTGDSAAQRVSAGGYKDKMTGPSTRSAESEQDTGSRREDMNRDTTGLGKQSGKITWHEQIFVRVGTGNSAKQMSTSTVLLKIQTKLDQICEMYTLVLSRVDFPIFALEG